MIGNITDAERIAMALCAEHADGGVCLCNAQWRRVNDYIRPCQRLLEKVRSGMALMREMGDG